jgi:hypothetical protein
MREGLKRAHGGRGGGGCSVVNLDGLVALSDCSCDKRFRSVCEGLPVNLEYEGKRYCVLHLPVGIKSLDLRKV